MKLSDAQAGEIVDEGGLEDEETRSRLKKAKEAADTLQDGVAKLAEAADTEIF